ncbi:MAG: site-specific integrase [Bacteroidota bacterium]
MKTEGKAIPEIIHETWRPRKDKTSAVKLRVTYKGQNRTWILKYPKLENEELAKLYGKTIALTEKEFPMATGKVKSKKFDELAGSLSDIKTKARDVIKELKVFSFDAFEANYFSKPKDKDDLFSAMASTGKQMRDEGRISTAVTYECGLNSLKEFSGKDKFPFERVSVKFLKDYEKWMLTPRVIEWKTKSGKTKSRTKVNSRTTVGIYLRNVRTVFNQVKPVGVLYPFGKSKQGLYTIPKGKNTKKALTQADVAKIASYPAIQGTIEHQSRDLWLFSYLCNGINIKDVVRLKYSNIKGDKITLIRAKTADSVEDETTIDIMITRQIGRIIDTHGNKPGTQDQYIFPILHNDMTPQDEYRAIQQAVQTINKNMTNVCNHLEIERATTYTARHSFATVLKRSGASVEFISESLGHRNKQTTQNYLANFEDEEKKKWANMLLPDTEL